MISTPLDTSTPYGRTAAIAAFAAARSDPWRSVNARRSGRDSVARATSASAGCGYTPANIYTAYDLNPLYRAGFNGKGRTLVLIEPCGTPTLLADANTFSKRFGLPALTSANFHIVSYPAPSACSPQPAPATPPPPKCSLTISS